MIVHKYTKTQLAVLDYLTRNQALPGSRIPSERTLCDIFSFSRITIRRALSNLADNGWLERRPRSGYFLLKQPQRATDRILLGYLAIGRKDRELEGFPVTHLFHSIPHHEMKERGVEFVSRYENEITMNVFSAFSSCAGLIVTDWVSDEWINALRGLDIPIYCMGNNYCKTEKLPVIDYDYDDMLRKIMANLLEKGCRKITILLEDNEVNSAKLMEKTYRNVLQENNIPVEKHRIIHTRIHHVEEDVLMGMKKNRDCDAFIGKVPSVLLYRKAGWKHMPVFANIHWSSGQKNVECLTPCVREPIILKAANVLANHIMFNADLPEKLLLKAELLEPVK